MSYTCKSCVESSVGPDTYHLQNFCNTGPCAICGNEGNCLYTPDPEC